MQWLGQIADALAYMHALNPTVSMCCLCSHILFLAGLHTDSSTNGCNAVQLACLCLPLDPCIANWCTKVCGELQVVHRDLKLENILLSELTPLLGSGSSSACCAMCV